MSPEDETVTNSKANSPPPSQIELPIEYAQNGLTVIIDEATGQARVVNVDGTPLSPMHQHWQKRNKLP